MLKNLNWLKKPWRGSIKNKQSKKVFESGKKVKKMKEELQTTDDEFFARKIAEAILRKFEYEQRKGYIKSRLFREKRINHKGNKWKV